MSVHFQSDVEPDDRRAVGVVVERLAPAQIDRLEPLWASLVRHHSALGGIVPFREPDDSWPRERALYLEILTDLEGFCLVARRGELLVAYAIAKIEDPEEVWRTGRLAELETLVVADDERGGGVGALMMDEVERELAARGVDDLLVGVEAPNGDARRFYERRGYGHAFTWLYGKPLSWAAEEESAGGAEP
jgi:ribosomal protein S18 acetylase RimI-like enzyme